jgi:small membrane protein
MNLFQWLFVTFCAVQLCFALARFRRSRQATSLLYAAVWLAAITLLLWPELTTRLAHKIGIGRGADLVLYFLAFVFLWGHYQHYVRYKRVEDHITIVVRELAIERARRPAELGASLQHDETAPRPAPLSNSP